MIFRPCARCLRFTHPDRIQASLCYDCRQVSVIRAQPADKRAERMKKLNHRYANDPEFREVVKRRMRDYLARKRAREKS